LSDHVTRLARESEEAVSSKFQRINNSGQPDHRMENLRAVPTTFQSSFAEDCVAQPQTSVEDNWMDWTFPSSNSDFDAFIESAVNVDSEASDVLTRSVDSASSGSGLFSNHSCFCIGECNCQTTRPPRTALSTTQAPPQTDTTMAKDEAIMTILQSLSRSMLALEKRLDAKLDVMHLKSRP
jgi:hypothetical protein